MEESLVKATEYISVKQLPIIEDTLAELHRQIQSDLDSVRNLATTEENYKELKKVRADWNKKIDILEKLRKKVKAEIEAPYKQFERGPYAELITEMRDAVGQLDDGIKEVEDVLRAEKQTKLFEFYDQYRQVLGLDASIADPKRSGIKVGLSDTMKSLKEQAKAYLERIDSDLKMIDTLENRDEVLVEYRISLNATDAVRIVNERHKATEELRKRREAEEEAKKLREEQVAEIEDAIKEAETLSAPTVEAVIEEENEPIMFVAFKVYGTIGKLKELKAFLVDNGYQFENMEV